jgi:surface protein
MPAGFEVVSKKSIENRKVRASFNPPFTDKIDSREWKRNPAWLELPTVTSTDDKFVGLFGVYPDSSFCALHATTSAGPYTVDWGDGTQETVTSNIVAYHEYDYTNSALAGTNLPATFDASTDRVSLTLNNYVNGDIIMFDTVTAPTGLSPLIEYYVRNVSGTTFQLSETTDGNIVNILANGSGNVLPYKQAIVTVTPSEGNVLTRIDLQRRHTANNITYLVPWLDISISLPSATSLVIGGATVYLRMLEKASLYNMGAVTSLASLFSDCYNLVSVPYFDVPATCTFLSLAFAYCRSLQTVPEINAQNVINLQQLFDGCYTLKEPISIINTSKVTNTSYMYRSCHQLKQVPWMDTSQVTSMISMFQFCYSLEEVPSYNTSKVTSMASVFSNCRRIEYIPFFDTSKVTSVNSMFISCYSLMQVPLYDFSLVTDASSLFNSCYSLREVPFFNFSSLIGASSLFSSCYSLERIPNYNFSNVTIVNNMFYLCRRLKEIPDLNFGVGNITNMTLMFAECDSLI